jgi:hypothetical protein
MFGSKCSACCCAEEGSGEVAIKIDNPDQVYPQPEQKPILNLPKDEEEKKPTNGEVAAAANEGANADAGANGAAADALEMTEEEMEQEATRLQNLVKEFAGQVITGIEVTVIDAQTQQKTPHLFQMDRFLTVFSFTPKENGTGSKQDVDMKGVSAVYCETDGTEISSKAPSLASVARKCVGFDIGQDSKRMFFFFNDELEREKFYTCLKILWMSVSVDRE